MNKLKLALFTCLFALLIGGCAIGGGQVNLPSEQKVIREQLVIHSDFHLPPRHRLINELSQQRDEISRRLMIPQSNKPIHVYLFKNEDQYHQYMVKNNPLFPNRRAFFVRDDEGLKVFAYWGSRVGEDLRHEVTHGYLHSVIPEIPLWLDEGIAEYFEVGRGKGGYNAPHAVHLAKLYERDRWKPDLARLEMLKSAKELTQTDYAESWLWVHFLLTGDDQARALIQDHLSDLMDAETAIPMLPKIENAIPDLELQLTSYLEMLAAQ